MSRVVKIYGIEWPYAFKQCPLSLLITQSALVKGLWQTVLDTN